MRRTKPKVKATHSVRFRLASQRWMENEWFSHKEASDIELLGLQSDDIRRSVDEWGQRNWEIQSSVDGGKTWQTQRNVRISF